MRKPAKTITVATALKPGYALQKYLKQHDLNFVEASAFRNSELARIADTIANHLEGFDQFATQHVRGKPGKLYSIRKSGLSQEETNDIEVIANILDILDFFSRYQNTADEIILRFKNINPSNAIRRFLAGQWLEIFAYNRIAELAGKFKNAADFEFYANLILQDRNGHAHEFDAVVFINGDLFCIECKTGKFSQTEIHKHFEILGVEAGNGILLGTKLSEANINSVQDRYQITACDTSGFCGTIKELFADADPKLSQNQQTEHRNTLDSLGHMIDKDIDKVADFISSVAGVYAKGNLQGSYGKNDTTPQNSKIIENIAKKLKETRILTEFSKNKRKHEFAYAVNPDPAAVSFIGGDWYKHAVFFIFSKYGHIVCDEVRRNVPMAIGKNTVTIDLVIRIRNCAIYVKVAYSDYEDKAKELAAVSARLPRDIRVRMSFVLVCRQIPDALKKQIASSYPIVLASKTQFENALADMIENGANLNIPC